MGFVSSHGRSGYRQDHFDQILITGKRDQPTRGVLYQTSVEAEDLLDLLLKEFEIRPSGAGRAARLGPLTSSS
jgi:hypothetical protein